MIKGWFVGDFEPSVLRSKDFEVAVKYYGKGESEEAHFHKIATEITVVVSGRVRMVNQEWAAGSIITLEPGLATDFLAIEDAVTVVVKSPSVLGDKYEVD
jgi:mannose-6-phosphate isomerase-like protein (cupin superfamily)